MGRAMRAVEGVCVRMWSTNHSKACDAGRVQKYVKGIGDCRNGTYTEYLEKLKEETVWERRHVRGQMKDFESRSRMYKEMR